MKKYIIIAGLFLSYPITLFAQENSKKYILALSVDLYMNTSSRVSCDKFATVFDKILTAKEVAHSDSIAMFSAFIQKAKYAMHDRGIDVRCKFIYEIDNTHTVTVCTDGRNIMVNGKLAKKNKKFIKFLNSIVNWYL